MSKSADEGYGFQENNCNDPDKNGNSNDGSINDSETNSTDTTPSKTSLQIAQNSSDAASSLQLSPHSSVTGTKPIKKVKPSGGHVSRKDELHATTSKSDSHVMSKKDGKQESHSGKSRPHSKPASNKLQLQSDPVEVTVTPPTPPREDSESARSSLSSGNSLKPNSHNLLLPPRSRVFEESAYNIETLSDPKFEKPPHVDSKTNIPAETVTSSNSTTPAPTPKLDNSPQKPSKNSTKGTKPTSKGTKVPVKSKSAPDSNSNSDKPKVKFAADTKAANDPQQNVTEEKRPPKPKNKNQELSILDGLAKFMTGEKMPDEVESKAPIMETPKTPTREFHDSASQTSNTNLKSDESTIRALNTAIIKLKEVRHKVENADHNKPSSSVKEHDKSKANKREPPKQTPKNGPSGKDADVTIDTVSQKMPSMDLTDEDLGPGFVRGSVSIDSASTILPLNKNDPNEVKEWQNSEFSSIRKDSKEFPPDFVPTVEISLNSESLIIDADQHPQSRKHQESLTSDDRTNDEDVLSSEYPDIDDLVKPHRQKDKNIASGKTKKANDRRGKNNEQCIPSCCNPVSNQFQAYQCSIVGDGDITESTLQEWVAEERTNCPKCELFEYILRQAGEEILDDAEIRRAFKQHMDYHVRKAVKEMKKIFGWAGKVSETEPDEIPEPRQCQRICDPYIKCHRHKERDQVKGKPNRGSENQSVKSEPSVNDADSRSEKLSGQVSPKESVMDKDFKPSKKKHRDREDSILDDLSKYMTGEKSTAPSNVPSKISKGPNGDNASSEASETQLPNDDSTILAIKTVIQKLEDRRHKLDSDSENRSETRSSLQDESSQSLGRNENRPRSSRSSQPDSRTKENSRDCCCCWHGCYHYCRCHETCKPHYHYGRTSKADTRRYSNDEPKSKQGYSHQRNRGKTNDYNYGSTWGENGNQRKCCCCMESERSEAVTVVCRSKTSGPPQRQRYSNNNRRCPDPCDRNHYCVEIQEPYWIQDDDNCDDGDCRQDEPCVNGYNHFYGCAATATNGNSILNKYIDDAIRKFMV